MSSDLTFEEAIAIAQALLNRMAGGEISEEEIQAAIASLVKSQNGARGFFVTYLTDERSLADRPCVSVIAALRTSRDIISDLLVKNLVMSAAMAITHRRNQDEVLARGSEQVSQRSAQLIERLNLDEIVEKLQQMRQSLVTGEGNYAAFLARWQYDEGQKQAMLRAIELIELSNNAL
jgi:hypothetical protein